MPDGMRIRKKEKGEGVEGREERSKLKIKRMYLSKLRHAFV